MPGLDAVSKTCPPTDGGVKKEKWSIHAVEYYSAAKGMAILAATRMDPEGTAE